MNEAAEFPIVIGVSILAAIINIAIIIYSMKLSKRMGKEGILHKTILFVTLASVFFLIHHVFLVPELGEVLKVIGEVAEGLAVLMLGIATYYFYGLVK